MKQVLIEIAKSTGFDLHARRLLIFSITADRNVNRVDEVVPVSYAADRSSREILPIASTASMGGHTALNIRRIRMGSSSSTTYARFALCLTLALGGCASTSTTRLANNIIRIDATAAPACGRTGAIKLVNKMAAVETIRMGFDKYLIAAMDQQNDIRVVGYHANTSGAYSGSGFGDVYSGTYSGSTTAMPIYAGSNDASIAVIMFKEGDSDGKQAINARQALGAEWQEVVAAGAPTTCT